MKRGDIVMWFALGCWTGFCIAAPAWYDLAMTVCGW